MAEAVLSSLYLVSYELYMPDDSRYHDFFQLLRNKGAVQTTTSVWILRSEESAESLFSTLRRVFPDADPLLVLAVDSIARGAFVTQGLEARIELLQRL